ncbi:MAG: HsdM family class I SAM-dependent methyltransferase [Anaerovoracaceae bacterium]
MSITTLLKSLRNIMRNDAGVDGDAQRLSQIVWILFLKVFDQKEKEWQIENEDYNCIIPFGYRWRDWVSSTSVKEQLTGDELIDFVNNKLIKDLSELNVADGKEEDKFFLIREFMGDATNYMKDGVLLRQVVNLFDGVHFDSSDDKHSFNEIYESMLKELQSAGKSGEFYTPRAVTSFIVEKVDPQIGEKVADFACGTGGFLIDALLHMQKQVKADTEQKKILSESIFGVEKKQLPYMLCTTNMILHGIDNPKIVHGNSLEKAVKDYGDSDLVDVVLMNPPYGGAEKTDIQKNFPSSLANAETADLFMIEILYRLKKDGRVGIVLPDGFLFGQDNSKVNIKQKLINEMNLHTVIRLPNSVFAPYTSITTNLLFFDNTKVTEKVWFYRLDMPEGYKAFSKTKPMESKHFKPARDWWAERKEIADAEGNYKSRAYGKAEIEKLGYNLDLCGYPNITEEILEPKVLIKEYMKQRTELEEGISKTLVKINKLLENK